MKLRPFQSDIVALMASPIHITLFEKNRDVGLVISSGRYGLHRNIVIAGGSVNTMKNTMTRNCCIKISWYFTVIKMCRRKNLFRQIRNTGQNLIPPVPFTLYLLLVSYTCLCRLYRCFIKNHTLYHRQDVWLCWAHAHCHLRYRYRPAHA